MRPNQQLTGKTSKADLRILTDIRRHLMHVPHFEEGDEISAYREGYHELYFKAPKTLEGEHNLISNYVGKSNM